LLFVGLAATGCTTVSKTSTGTRNSSKAIRPAKVTYNYTTKDRDCLKRAMYFESEHSDHDGYMAVGTVVMNRLTSGAYPSSICGIVSQEKQFAPGVMTRVVSPLAEPELDLAADALLLRGERHPGVKDAMFFHTQGLKFPYDNMHYVTVAGGNAFYEKRAEDGTLETPAPLPAYEVAMNYVSVPMAMTAQFSPPPAIPATVPVPALAPTDLPGVSLETTASIHPDMTSSVAIPSPRPAFDSPVSSASLIKAGG